MSDSSRVTSKRKLKTRHLLIPAVTGGLLTMFVNCSQFAALPPGSFLSAAQSTCLAMNNARKLASYDVSSICESAGNYVCTQEIASSSAVTSNGEQAQCADLTGLGHVCLSVDVSTVKGPDQTSFHCANSEVANPGQYLIQASGPSLGEALAGALAKCRARTL